ncbi:MAG: hypothetical protein N2037_14290 [Acidimicrobiales bacterium]|nr:hypothetical protein [Acidimicrobiales bacterium]
MFVLFISISLSTYSAELTLDAPPTSPAPGKISAFGKLNYDPLKEISAGFNMFSSPTGGVGGIGSWKTPTLNKDGTFSVMIEDLDPNKEYDVVLSFRYISGGKNTAIYTKTYKIKPEGPK